jgi:CheY-like chemotaxis protein
MNIFIRHQEETMSPTQSPPTSILIADDDPAALMLLRRAMESEGYTVVEATDGVEAVEVFQRTRRTLALLDALMPNMSGLDACAHLRALPGGRDLPVIIVTAASDLDTITRVKELKATYVGKPYSVIELGRHVNDIIQSRKPADIKVDTTVSLHSPQISPPVG